MLYNIYIPKDLVKLILSFLFQCRICLKYQYHPMYNTCRPCYIEYKDVCFWCFYKIEKTYCSCHKMIYLRK